MKFEKIELEQGSQEWLDYRKNKINASEMACIDGCSPFTPKNWHDLSQIKKGEKEIFVTPAMRAGAENEDRIRKQASVHFGLLFLPMVGRRGYFSASLDGVSEKTAIEIKYSHKTYKFVTKTGKIPDNYYCQVQMQMYVFDLVEVIFWVEASKSPCGDSTYIIVKRDDNTIKKMRKKGVEFLWRHRKNEIKTDKKEVKDFDSLALANKYIALKSQMQEIKKEIDELTDTIKSKFKEDCQIGKLTITTVNTNRVDYKSIIKDLKFDTKKYEKTTKSTKILIKKG